MACSALPGDALKQHGQSKPTPTPTAHARVCLSFARPLETTRACLRLHGAHGPARHKPPAALESPAAHTAQPCNRHGTCNGLLYLAHARSNKAPIRQLAVHAVCARFRKGYGEATHCVDERACNMRSHDSRNTKCVLVMQSSMTLQKCPRSMSTETLQSLARHAHFASHIKRATNESGLSMFVEDSITQMIATLCKCPIPSKLTVTYVRKARLRPCSPPSSWPT